MGKEHIYYENYKLDSISELYDGNVILNIFNSAIIKKIYEGQIIYIINQDELVEFNELTRELQNYSLNNIWQREYRRNIKEKFDLIFKISNLIMSEFKEDKNDLFETFIKRNLSEELFIINLCYLLKTFSDKLNDIVEPYSRNSKELLISKSCSLEYNKIFSESNISSNDNSNENFQKEDLKCLNNNKNMNRNNLIIKSARGIPNKSVGLSNTNEEDLTVNHIIFLKPTCPVINCSAFNEEYIKYTFKKEETKQSKIQSNLNKSEANYEYKLNKFVSNILINWVAECHLIKRSEISNISLENIIARCTNGILLADLVNELEGRLSPIKGIDRTNSNLTKNKQNVCKVLEFLRKKGKVNRRFLFEEEKILKGDENIITGLLFDIYDCYSNNSYTKKKLIEYSNVSKVNSINKMNSSTSNNKEEFSKTEFDKSHKLEKENYFYNSCNKVDAFDIKVDDYNKIRNNKINDRKNLTKYGISVLTSPKEKPYLTRYSKVDSGKVINTSPFNSRKITFDGQFSSITSQDTFNDVNQIKNWLFSIGINFAKDIDFTKPTIEEFRDGLLLIELISNLDPTNKIIFDIRNYPKSKAEALKNIKNALRVLASNKKSIPLEFLKCEEEIYKAETEFIVRFLKILKKSYYLEKEFNDTLTGKQLGNSSTFSSRSTLRSIHKNVSLMNSNNYVMNNTEKNFRSIKANKKDNSQRKFYSPIKPVRNLMLSHPKFAWC